MNVQAMAEGIGAFAVHVAGGGETLTLHRRVTLWDCVAVADPSTVLDGIHALGAATITVKNAATGGKMTGSVPVACTVAIAGDATTYTTTASADADADVVDLPVSPVLAAGAADEAGKRWSRNHEGHA